VNTDQWTSGGQEDRRRDDLTDGLQRRLVRLQTTTTRLVTTHWLHTSSVSTR